MEKLIAKNKKAYFDFFVEDTYEAGIVLVGSEVKSLRAGKVSLRDSFAVVKHNEVFIMNAHIAPYEKGSFFNTDSRRTRKLLLNRAEINKIRGKVEQKGYTLVPLRMYFVGSLVKVELGLCKGKEMHDKRASIKEKENNRNMQRIMKEYRTR